MLKPWGNAKLIGYAFDFAFFSCTRSSALRYILSFVYGEVPVLTLLDYHYVVDEEQVRTCSILLSFGASFHEFYPWNDKRNKVSPFYKWCLHLMSYYGSIRLPLIFLTALSALILLELMVDIILLESSMSLANDVWSHYIVMDGPAG